MVDNKGDTSKQQQQPPQEASPKDPLEESSSETRQQLHHHHRHHYHQQPPPQPPPAPPPPPLPVAVVVTGGPFISPPIFVPTTSSSSPFEQQKQFETVNPKRPRYGNTGQWKLLPSPSSQQQKIKQTQMAILSTETSPQSKPQPQQPQPQQQTPPDSSSNTVSTSSKSARTNSPIPSLSAASGQDTNKPTESEDHQFLHHQLRRGKYVSPVWKPNEMLWLARAWRVQYQGGGGGGGGGGDSGDGTDMATQHQQLQPSSKGKTRADKDREVAEYLNRHGVKRDAKTAGTKWDNMLGEFRKVYEWERGSDRISSSTSFGERERSEQQQQQLPQGGKSYFRLSPYERKLHRLPASFDEEVFDELSQFMGSRMRTSPMQSRGGGGGVGGGSSTFVISGGDQDGSSRGVFGGVSKTLALPAPPLRDDDNLSLPGIPYAVRAKQLAMASGGEAYFHGGGNRGNLLGFDTTIAQDMITNPSSASKDHHHQLRRIGKIRMVWEESVTLWGDQQQQHHHHNQEGGGGGQGSSRSSSVGRVKLQGSSFLNADELTFFDESMVACSLEAFEDGPYKGFSVDKFLSGQQVKVFGRRKSSSSSSAPTSSGFTERFQLPLAEQPSIIRSTPPWEFQDPTEYYVGCLRVPPATLPSLFELSWHLQEPPPEEFRFPLRRDVYRDLPQGKELFFSTSTEPLDCRAITYDILSPIFRTTPSISGATATGRDSFIGLWDDCINRIVSKFCSVEMVLVRKPSSSSSISILAADSLQQQDEWPNVTGFVRNFCLWRGEETDQLRNTGHSGDPSSSIISKLLWSYTDLPYILGYYAVGYIVTFCALSRSQDRVIRTDLYSLDLSASTDRLKALISCWRIAGLLPLLADRCFNNINTNNNNFKTSFTYSDFERIDLGNGNIVEMTPNAMTRFFSSKRKWAAVKEIYDFLDHRIPHAEQIVRSSEKDLALVFKPRGCRSKPTSTEQLIEALKYVTKALVALHDLSFMHRDLGWDKVMRRSESTENEWFVCGFDEAVGAPQIYPHGGGGGGGSGGTTVVGVTAAASGRHAPEMGRGLHGVKVDVWGVGQLVRTCGLVTVPKLLRELQNRCLDQNPEQRPTAADCYHHLLQLQSSLSASAGGY